MNFLGLFFLGPCIQAVLAGPELDYRADDLLNFSDTKSLCVMQELLKTYAESGEKMDINENQMKNAMARLESMLNGTSACKSENMTTTEEPVNNGTTALNLDLVFGSEEYGLMEDAYKALTDVNGTVEVKEDKNTDEHFYIMDDTGGIGEGVKMDTLCTDCHMDYDKAENKDFQDEFVAAKEAVDENPIDGVKRIVIISVVAVVGTIIIIVVVLFFGVRFIIKRTKKKKKKTGEDPGDAEDPLDQGAYTAGIDED